MFAACSTDDTQDITVVKAPDTITISFEQDTRAQLNDQIQSVWTAEDRVSVFYFDDANCCYRFTGQTGDRTGTFERETEKVPNSANNKTVVVYPYSEYTSIMPSTSTVTTKFPTTQTYLKDSYGVGSSIMLYVGTGNSFSLRNLCGWLELKFTGSGTVKKIEVRGNNGEQFADRISFNYDTFASLVSGTGGDFGDLEIGGSLSFDEAMTLDCGEGVALDAEQKISFYIALLPTTFEKGITATVTFDNGSVVEKTASGAFSIDRNTITPFSTISVKPFIAFVDAAVKSLCVTYWDTNKDGELSYAEAAAVTTLDTVFEDITTIKTFNELQYFTGLTSIRGYAFSCCSSLESITIPDNVTSIKVFAFSNCSSLTNITIPDTVTEIEESAFSNCSSLTSVYCKATTPPTLNSNSFYSIAASAKIYVPTASVNAYKTATGWSEYADMIIGYDFAE